MPTRRQLISFAFLLVAGAGASGQKVTVEYAARVDYSEFLTYAWARGTQVKDPRIDRAIIEGIDWRLGATGLQRVDASGDPDLVVVYYAAEGTQLEVNTANLAGWGPGWGSSLGYNGTDASPVRHIEAGELAVEVAQVKSRQFIWRGTATATISESPNKMGKLINRALDKMFQRFPPTSDSSRIK